MNIKRVSRVVSIGEVYEYRSAAIDVLMKAKLLDGKKKGRTLSEINKDIIEENKKNGVLDDEVLQKAQELNIKPSLLKMLSGQDLNSFKGLPKEPIYQEIYFDGDDEPLVGISNTGNYFDKDILNKIIGKWFKKEEGEVDFLNEKNVEYLYNDTFSYLVLLYQKQAVISGNIDSIDFNENSYGRPFIYKYEALKPSFQDEFEKFYVSWKIRKEESADALERLRLEQEFSDRGSIWVDNENSYGRFWEIEGDEFYEFNSVFFWKLNDILFEVHEENYELFNEGWESVLKEVHDKFLLNHPSFKDRYSDFEMFKLLVFQQFYYIGNKEKHLRLDLARNFDSKIGIEGGIFHSLKHFSKNGKPIALSKEKGAVEYIEKEVFDLIRAAFFKGSLTPRVNNDNQLSCFLKDTSGNEWEIGFFFDEKKKLHSLNTIHRKRNSDES